MTKIRFSQRLSLKYFDCCNWRYQLFLLGLFSIFITFGATAQSEKDSTNNSIDINVVHRKERPKIIFDQEERSNEKMRLPLELNKKIKTAHRFVKFPFRFKPLTLNISLPKIARKEENKQTISSQNFIRVGGGNYGTSYFEGLASNYKSEKILFGVAAKHLAAASGAVATTRSATSENSAKLFGKFFIQPDTEISAMLQFQQKAIRFYADPVPAVSKDFPTQKYTLLEAEIAYERANIHSKITLQTAANFYQFSEDLFQNSEQNITLKAKGIYAINDVNSLSFKGKVIFNKYENREDDKAVFVDRNLFLGDAIFRIRKTEFSLNMGLGFSYNADATDSQNQLNFYPNISAKYQIIKNKLTLNGEVKGNLKQQTFRSLVSQNPFLAPNGKLKHTNNKLNIAFGLQAKPTNKINIELMASYRLVENMYFFSNKTTDNSQFEVLYDNGESTVLGLNFNTSLQLSDFKILFDSQFDKYNLNSLENPWHRPTIKNSLTVSHHIEDGKILLSSQFYHLGGLKAKEVLANRTQNLDPIFDMNLKAEYFFKKKISYGKAALKPNKWSAFVAINNLFGKNYERYLYYPTKGITVLLGLNYKF